MLRTLIRRSSLPAAVREALRLEGGINDVVLLPIVVLSILALTTSGGAAEFGRHAVGLFLLGPGARRAGRLRRHHPAGAGAEAGRRAARLRVALRARVSPSPPTRRPKSVGGSGFLAAFAAGAGHRQLDVELCDCFLEYGEATAEMLLLFTFVAFGASLIWTGVGVADWRTLLFAGDRADRASRWCCCRSWPGKASTCARGDIIAWIGGPRGLSSLLLILLPVFAGVPGSDRLFAITCLVVLLSVAIHGTAITVFLQEGRGYARSAAGRATRR